MKKLFTLLTMLVIGISGMWADGYTCILFGNSTGVEGLTTDNYELTGALNFDKTLSDGTAMNLKGTAGKFWSNAVNNTTWENTVAIEEINTALLPADAEIKFSADYFKSGGWQFVATGAGTSTSTLKLTLTPYNEGDKIVLYAAISSSASAVSNFSASGLDNMSMSYATNTGDGFSTTQSFSSATRDITIVKIQGELQSSKVVSLTSSTPKNGWQMIAYGVYHQVTFKCKVNGELIYTESVFAKTGDVLNVPDLPGYTASPSSFTVESTDASPEITYTASSYPVNFTRGQTFTRSDRHINSVTFDIAGEDQTVNDVYQNTSTKCYQDLTESKTVRLPINTSVTPQFHISGVYQHVFVYVDWNKDGDFTDDGELVSKINSGNPGSNPTLPVFTTGASAGSYRMRIKTDWTSPDPAGNTGDDPHTITSNNHIIKNGGMIVDVTLDLFEPQYYVQYIVKDGSDNVLFTSEPVATTNGAHITTLPEEYQLTNFYEYNTVDVTISASGNTNVEFTATPKSDAPVKYTADTSNPYYYNLNIRSQYLVYNSEATGQVTLQSTSEPFNPNASWAFIGEPYAGFKLINKTKGTGYFLTYTSVVTGGNGGSDGSNNNVQFVAAADFNNRYWIVDKNTGGFCMRMKENTNIYFHHQNIQNATGYLRTCSVAEWSGVHNDAGSTIVASTDEDLLIALYNSMKDYTYSDAIGQYSAQDVTAEDANATILSVGSAIDNKTTAAYADCYSALNTLQAKTTLNTPAAGFYRVKNVATNGYLYATAASGYTSTNRYVYANGSNSGAETIVQLVEHEGHLYMLNQGHEFGWVAESSTGSGQVGYVRNKAFDKYVNWLPGTAAGQIAFAICYGNGTGDHASYLTQGIYAVDTNDNAVIRGTEGYTANTAQWVFEPATELSITLNNGGDGNYYATLCVPFDVTISDATAYTLAKSESGNYLVPTEVDQVPAGTPVLLKGTNATATATINTGSAFNDGSTLDCALTGIYVTTSVDATTNYVFGKFNGKVGFYHVNNNAFSLKANRAYLEATTDQARGFVLNFDDEATGIVAPTADTAGESTIYNLSGQRLNKMQKGINIVNGKKVLF